MDNIDNKKLQALIDDIKKFHNENPNPQLKDYKGQVKNYESPANKWKEEVRKQFLKHFQVASTGQSRFTNETIDKLSKDKDDNKDWEILANYIDSIIALTDKKDKKSLVDKCKEFESLFDNAKNEKANKLSISLKVKPQLAIRAMICSLCPSLLCRIVKDDCLDYLYKYINKRIISGKAPVSDETTVLDKATVLESCIDKWKEVQTVWGEDKPSWYEKSYVIADFFNTVLKEEKNSNDLEEFAAVPWDFYENVTKMEIYEQKVKQQKNIILTGAPGTGKTYLANQIAEKIIGKEPQTDDENVKKEYRKTHIKFVQFHPSYDYTDFVEGLRPQKGKDSTFERVDGTFKAFCKNAVESIKENRDENFVFIIDEINRGEISKILGELFFSIDPGYRVQKWKINTELEKPEHCKSRDFVRVDTQYQNLIEEDNDVFKDGFYVPENVYIIGTMNDIDRSVESMDFAFRRRFAFHEVKAGDSQNMLYQLEKRAYDAIKKMDDLNEVLVKKCGLTTAYQIGGAYFLKLKDVDYDFKRLWDEYLRGVLFEYFRGEPDVVEKMKILETAYDGKTDQDSEKDNK